MKKTKIKYAVLLGLLLCKSGTFGASEATKKLIHETLAKYGLSAGGKERQTTIGRQVIDFVNLALLEQYLIKQHFKVVIKLYARMVQQG